MSWAVTEVESPNDASNGCKVNDAGEEPTNGFTDELLSTSDGHEYFCGCGPCHPAGLQTLFRRKKFFTFLICTFVFLQSGLISGLISVVLSTIEKRYSLSSIEAGLIVITYDITVTFLVTFVSYFGGKTHKPRILGLATVIMSFGAFLFALPHFIFTDYSANSDDYMLEVCLDQRNTTIDTCNNANHIAYAIFLISNVVLAIGASPIYNVGVAYIDEIVYPRYVSLHVGMFSIVLVTAPLFGYGFGSLFLSLYVNPWMHTSLTVRDPAWVGAWWIPFVIVAVLLLILSIPFLMFPRYLPDSHLVRQERAKEMAKIYSSKYANENSLSITFKMFPIHIKRLFLNPSFVFAGLGLSSVYLFFQGIVSFGAKYYEVQFRFTAFTAGLVVGGIGLPGAIFGTLTGALIVFGCKLKGRGNALILTILAFIMFLLSVTFLLHCPGQEVAGITTPYYGESSPNWQQYDGVSCVRLCNCTSNLFEPVCGDDGLTYFSPCRAGCVANTEFAGYENCGCIAASSLYNISTVNATAVDGYCDSQCLGIIIPAVLLLGVLTYVTFMISLPYLHFILRVVSDEQRSLALGVQSALNNILGTIPAPVIFGALFDAACISWQEDCGRRGNCWIYDNTKLSYYVISLGMPCLLLGTTFYFLAWLTHPKRKKNAEKADMDLATIKRNNNV